MQKTQHTTADFLEIKVATMEILNKFTAGNLPLKEDIMKMLEKAYFQGYQEGQYYRKFLAN